MTTHGAIHALHVAITDEEAGNMEDPDFCQGEQ